MDSVAETPMSPAERHYLALKKAQAAYHRRKNPNPKPRGRPPKNVLSGAGVAETPLVENVV